MIDPVSFSPLNPVGPSSQPGATQPATRPADGPGFAEVLLRSLEKVNQLQVEADQGVSALATGETDNVAEVFNAVNKAGLAFDMLMEIRNKLVDAYQEIQQIRV